jgi:hypothetical protein
MPKEYIPDTSEEYSSDTVERIWTEVQRIQAINDPYKLAREDIDAIAQLIDSHPYGEVIADSRAAGEKRPRNTYRNKTILHVAWYSWRRKKWVYYYCHLQSTSMKDSRQPVMIKQDYNKEHAWFLVFLDRYRKYQRIKAVRYLVRKGYAVPTDLQDMYVQEDRCGMVLVNGSNIYGIDVSYLCSPLGYIETEHCDRIVDAAKSIGIKLPKNAKNCTWENIEPAWIVAQLQRL